MNHLMCLDGFGGISEFIQTQPSGESDVILLHPPLSLLEVIIDLRARGSLASPWQDQRFDFVGQPPRRGDLDGSQFDLDETRFNLQAESHENPPLARHAWRVNRLKLERSSVRSAAMANFRDDESSFSDPRLAELIAFGQILSDPVGSLRWTRRCRWNCRCRPAHSTRYSATEWRLPLGRPHRNLRIDRNNSAVPRRFQSLLETWASNGTGPLRGAAAEMHSLRVLSSIKFTHRPGGAISRPSIISKRFNRALDQLRLGVHPSFWADRPYSTPNPALKRRLLVQ